MFYTFKNFPVRIDGREIYATNASLGVEASLSENFTTESRHSERYVPTNGVVGSARITYYITGADPIKPRIYDETGTISGYFGGLYFNSGYLKSYSFNVAPHGIARISSDIVFFEQLKGSQVNQSLPPNTGYDYIKYSDCSISPISSYSTEGLESIIEASFSFSSDIEPYYTAQSGDASDIGVSPSFVRYGKKEITCEVISDNLSGNLPFTGKRMGIEFSIKKPNTATLDTFSCSGTMTSRSINSSVGNLIVSSIQIKQSMVDPGPAITGITLNASAPGSFVLISGYNLQNPTRVMFGDRYAHNYYVTNPNLISGIVPHDAITGYLTVETYGGKSTSTTPYNLSFPAMSINAISPTTGTSGTAVMISGNNFYRISHVYFGINALGSFNNINSGIIMAYPPITAQSGYIKVVATGRNAYVNSTIPFFPSPIITGFHPVTGMPWETITISGINFSGTVAVKFNGINSPSFGLVAGTNGQRMTAVVPTGYVRGYIQITGMSGVSTYSTSNFFAALAITGISNTVGIPGDEILLSGVNFQSGVMYQESLEFYRVKLNNVTTGFRWVSSGVLSGRLPPGFISGPIGIMERDGAAVYPNTIYYTLGNAPIAVAFVSPNRGYMTSNYSSFVDGENLNGVTGIYLSGLDTANLGRTYFIPSGNIKSDLLGKRLNIVNYTGIVQPTGTYASPYTPTGRFSVRLVSSGYSLAVQTRSSGRLEIVSGSLI